MARTPQSRVEDALSGIVCIAIALVFVAACLPSDSPPDWRYAWGSLPFLIIAAVLFWRSARPRPPTE
jgi:hypothetical protein